MYSCDSFACSLAPLYCCYYAHCLLPSPMFYFLSYKVCSRTGHIRIFLCLLARCTHMIPPYFFPTTSVVGLSWITLLCFEVQFNIHLARLYNLSDLSLTIPVLGTRDNPHDTVSHHTPGTSAPLNGAVAKANPSWLVIKLLRDVIRLHALRRVHHKLIVPRIRGSLDHRPA